MITYEAPAKLNLALLVGAPGPSGLHSLRSLAQTVEWCDLLSLEEGEGEDSLEVTGAALSAEDNLVSRAVDALRRRVPVPPLEMRLEKRIPVAAGLGGGSADAAAALRAAEELAQSESSLTVEVAPELGADVPLFLVGGSMEVTGTGEQIELLPALADFAVAVVVPELRLATGEVYRRWDDLGGPEGETVPDSQLPPSLRRLMPMRNDLLAAALDLAPELGDFMADVRSAWGTAVCLTGSGSACFGYFASIDEANHAASAVSGLCDVAVGVRLRDRGVAPHDAEPGETSGTR